MRRFGVEKLRQFSIKLFISLCIILGTFPSTGIHVTVTRHLQTNRTAINITKLIFIQIERRLWKVSIHTLHTRERWKLHRKSIHRHVYVQHIGKINNLHRHSTHSPEFGVKLHSLTASNIKMYNFCRGAKINFSFLSFFSPSLAHLISRLIDKWTAIHFVYKNALMKSENI